MDKVIVVGNLGGDPELRYTKNGTPVASFSLASERRVKVSGNWEKKTIWYRCTVWGKRAQAIVDYLAKGDGMAVEGELSFDVNTGSPRMYTGKDGVVRASFDVRVTDWDITNHRSGKKPALQQPPAQQWQQPPAQQWQQPPAQPQAWTGGGQPVQQPPQNQMQQRQQPAQQPQQSAQRWQPQAGGYDDEIPF